MADIFFDGKIYPNIVDDWQIHIERDLRTLLSYTVVGAHNWCNGQDVTGLYEVRCKFGGKDCVEIGGHKCTMVAVALPLPEPTVKSDVEEKKEGDITRYPTDEETIEAYSGMFDNNQPQSFIEENNPQNFELKEAKERIHELKTWSEHFNQVFMGHKTFEVRLNDRDFKVGDTLTLIEGDLWGDYPEGKRWFPTGRKLSRRITHILHGGQFGIREGYCVMSIQ